MDGLTHQMTPVLNRILFDSRLPAGVIVTYLRLLALACCTGYRLPEPTRWAHKVASGEKLDFQAPVQPSLF